MSRHHSADRLSGRAEPSDLRGDRAQGFFAEEVSVNLTTTPSSVFQAEKVAAGDFEIAFTAFDNVVAYSEGQGAPDGGSPDYCRHHGRDAARARLRGRARHRHLCRPEGPQLALDALSTGFAFVLYDMLERGGLNKGDYYLAAVGATPQRWESVKAGAHAGTLTIEPFTSIARRAGFKVLNVSTHCTRAIRAASSPPAGNG